MTIRSVLGVTTFSPWVYEFNISDVMIISYVAMPEFMEKSPLPTELTKDFMLYKIALQAISLFCVTTEFKHISAMKRLTKTQKHNA